MANFGERYELIRRIGSGGMGEVWLAHDEQLANRPVAIKIMHQHMLPNAGDVARFEREMRFAAMMDHPNIVTVYTTGTCDGAPYMVMEYLRGHDLKSALSGGDAERIAAIGQDICSALAYAHGKGVIHRDIKPGNLFLCDTGQVKVTDFGIARAVGGTTLSSAGVLAGTFAYLPPEQWRGEPPAFSNDIWAVGCVLYRLLSGRPPRVFSDAAEYAAAAMRGDPIPDLRDITGAPAWLAAAVMAMLAADPARRPAADDCVQLLSGATLPAPVPDRPAPGWPSPGQPGPSQPGPDESDPGQPGLRPVSGAAGQRPAIMSTVPLAVPTTSDRPRRPGRVIAAIAGVVVLLLAGSIIALRLRTSPQASGPAPRAVPRRLPQRAMPPRRLSQPLPHPRPGQVSPRRRQVPPRLIGGYPAAQCEGQLARRKQAGYGAGPERSRPGFRQGAAGARERRIPGRGQAHAARADRDEHEPVRPRTGRKRDHRRVRHRAVNRPRQACGTTR